MALITLSIFKWAFRIRMFGQVWFEQNNNCKKISHVNEQRRREDLQEPSFEEESECWFEKILTLTK